MRSAKTEIEVVGRFGDLSLVESLISDLAESAFESLLGMDKILSCGTGV